VEPHAGLNSRRVLDLFFVVLFSAFIIPLFRKDLTKAGNQDLWSIDDLAPSRERYGRSPTHSARNHFFCWRIELMIKVVGEVQPALRIAAVSMSGKEARKEITNFQPGPKGQLHEIDSVCPSVAAVGTAYPPFLSDDCKERHQLIHGASRFNVRNGERATRISTY
jgi:hypothetical protein